MQVLDRISAIERRAAEFNLSIKSICEAANVSYGNVWRWRSRRSSPNVDRFEATMIKLDAELDRVEAEARERLNSEPHRRSA